MNALIWFTSPRLKADSSPSSMKLPIFPELTESEIDFVIERTLEWDKAAS
jgi:hypothetical protein